MPPKIIYTELLPKKSKWLKHVLMSCCLFFIAACETDKITFEGPYHVRFSESSAFEKESFSKVINIEVHLVGPALEEDVTLNYAIAGDAREGVDYSILGERGQVTIPKGKYFGVIQLQLINNANNILRSQNIIFTLQSVSSEKLQIGQGESQIGKSFTFTIFDDCILNGNYTGSRSTFSIPTKNISISSSDCKNYRLSNWSIDLFYSPFDFDLTFIDNDDNTITIPEQESDDLPERLDLIYGFGVVDPTSRQITITLTLAEFENSPQFTFVLTPD